MLHYEKFILWTPHGFLQFSFVHLMIYFVPLNLCSVSNGKQNNLALYTLCNTVSRESLLSLYVAKFYSLINYGVIFWGSVYGEIITLFRLQKRANRLFFLFT